VTDPFGDAFVEGPWSSSGPCASVPRVGLLRFVGLEAWTWHTGPRPKGEDVEMSENKPAGAPASRVTVPRLLRMKQSGERIAMVTAYDATFARMIDEGGADILLVGDSLGMVVQGLDTTLPVTVDEMVYHCRAVSRGARRALVVGDMPFLSAQITPGDALRNAGRFLAEGGAHAVKLEGGRSAAPTVRRLVDAGIPVMGHVGLLPQSVHAMGGFRVQGKTEDAAARILDDAHAIAEAGAFSVVLEGVPSDLAAQITRELGVPTIGIGAGPECDGQVLVCYDLLGLTPDLKPKFVKRYAELYAEGRDAVARYCDEVRAGSFPSDEHGFGKVKRDESASPDAPDAPPRPGYGPQA
jgi:3-methyl-2-oxobutanoate hydroxymethyltransferase